MIPIASSHEIISKQNARQKLAIQRVLAQRIQKPEDYCERLTKSLAHSGVGSRRQCDDLIAAGKVYVNRIKAVLGQRITTADEITIAGKHIKIKWQDRVARIILYHKLAGEVVTRSDPNSRTTVYERIAALKNKRFIAVGRLDCQTTGLLIFTNSGGLAQQLMHPKYAIQREYVVRLYGCISAEQQEALIAGVELDDGIAKVQHISIIARQDADAKNQWYKVIIAEGRNREIRRIFASIGITVIRLMRVRFGNISLPPRLKRGQHYELSPLEVSQVMNAYQLNIAGDIIEKN